MKKLFLVLVILLLCASPLYAGTWCMWDGAKGINCRSNSSGFVRLPNGISVAEKDFNEYGYYELTTTQPVLGANQVADSEVWNLVGNQMSRTWTVRDLTNTEIDQRIASPMDITDYYLWKALIVTGTITQQQAATNLPQQMIDAYLARKRLLGD